MVCCPAQQPSGDDPGAKNPATTALGALSSEKTHCSLGPIVGPQQLGFLERKRAMRPLEPRALPSTVLAPDGSVRYFAYGSNLGRQKVLSRGAASIISTERANVAGWRLAFTFALNPPLEPSFASIEPAPAETVCEGVLHTLTPSAYEELWRSEGGGGSRPDYDEIVVLAKPWSGSEPVRAITLRAAQSRRLSHDVPPSQRYLSMVVAGAHEAGELLVRRSGGAGASAMGLLSPVIEKQNKTITEVSYLEVSAEKAGAFSSG
ncbi:hypothetical protein EMIHUDRAFT_229109 [Emiliania huxleyi CCMP1516]|uniref:gamma-glutamylcyclotransferase n=2 Tax=Emiliania huxleyi TaxID=2903 RepID=A0A0D3KDJ2_EMIH1|nr:hypothetical protein EMIHUDRAFT_229109 [Emiliania huxleyi CCMP1516]EOD33827.1 hypothetical protein EMIHUDRAFT_229109 [Emiliania huxleyi CCMP1516]|eukprot:XP_005786256.1 hypothetical protein EMIHUDRAFT_229109 [Emiliania huxleyi CCMP1516]